MTQPDLCIADDQQHAFPAPHDRPQPIRLWSASTVLEDTAAAECGPVTLYAEPEEQSPVEPTENAAAAQPWSTFRRRSTPHWQTPSPIHPPAVQYLVAGLDVRYPEHLFSQYKVEPAVWSRFVQAMNAALSEFPSWKDPHELTEARRRRFSFDASMTAASGTESVWTDDVLGERGRNRAEAVLRWWNEDYFKGKGCWVRLGFRRDDIPSCTDGIDPDPDVAVSPDGEGTAIHEPDPADSAQCTATGRRSSSGASTLKPFLTVRPCT